MSEIADQAQRVAEVVRRELQERTLRPEVTYRLQFHPERFTFRDAAAFVPYLKALGANHVYASPYLKARRGSEHGYDVVDHHQLNPELGTPEDYAHLVEVLHENGMGQILDVVPNHMGVATSENGWWTDVLENGPSSPYAHFFDIDWFPVKPELRNKVLLPMLGDQYGAVLESGELRLQRDGGAFILKYYELTLPIEPKSSSVLLSHRIEELRDSLKADDESLIELESILTALEHLPAYTRTDAQSIHERQREKEVIKGRLERLADESPPIAEFLTVNVEEFNGDPAAPRSFDLLDDLLELQVYRLSHWKAASDEINYRRFFDINELAALCMEEPDVFEETHRFIFDLLADGSIDGLRIDHIDGLFDPEEYLWRLQWGYVRALGRRAFLQMCREREQLAVGSWQLAGKGTLNTQHSSLNTQHETETEWERVEPAFVDLLHRDIGGPAIGRLFPGLVPGAGDDDENGESVLPGPRIWSRHNLPLYVAVEKILEADEDLPANWPVAGTTGYEFLNSAAGLFVDAAGARELQKRYQRFTGEKKDLRDVIYECKRLIINIAMAGELQSLAVRISRLSEQHRRFRDFTLNNLRTALQEIIACFPVYRTYITAESAAGVSERDREFLAIAVRRAQRKNPALDVRMFEFVRDVLLLRQPPELDPAGRHARRFFVGRMQQVTSPVMAKGVEDTAFYRYFPLSSLNEVGGGFDTLSDSGGVAADFHAENLARYTRRPGSLLCSTSHDTKRSEDVRARISVLSEIPDQWRAVLSEWSRLNRRHRRPHPQPHPQPHPREIDGELAPSRNDEYLFYQTLVGAWPLAAPDGAGREQFIERVQDYMQKATHEAKVRTSWVNPDPDYDEAVHRFVRGALEESPGNRFLTSFQEFHERICDWGLYSALSQLLLKLTAPGVPDLYQGQEIWDFSLVDPDNRRPVDYELRKWLLGELQHEAAQGKDALLGLARRLAAAPRDDHLKLYVTWRSLQFRRQQASLFREGRYVPLSVEGSRSEHLIAFAWVRETEEGRVRGQRSEGHSTLNSQPSTLNPRHDDLAIVAVPRLLAKLAHGGRLYGDGAPPAAEIWQETSFPLQEIPQQPLANLFTGQSVTPADGALPVAQVLADFPVAILCREELVE